MAGTGGGADAAHEAAWGGGSSVGGGSQGGGGGGRRQNFTSAFAGGELVSGARAPVVPGFGFTRRADQTLGDIQQQNAIGNANFNASQQNRGSNNAGSRRRAPTFTTQKRRNPKTGVVEEVLVAVVPPVPPVSPVPPNYTDYRAPYNPSMEPVPPSPPYRAPYNPGMEPPMPDYPKNQPTPGLAPGGLVPGGLEPGGLGGLGTKAGNDEHAPGGGPGGLGYGGQRQFGGAVAPGRQYTVGENGPETLQMGPQGGGQVIPHNPMDRLGSMSPQMMQQMFQLRRQFGGQHQPMQPPPQHPQMPPQQMGQQQPPVQGGFGLSNLGQAGVLGQLRNRQGFGGGIR